MKTYWIGLWIITTIFGYVITTTHIRHKRYPTADISNDAPIIQIFSNQHELLHLECKVSINITGCIWLKDGEVVQTASVEGSKRSSGHRFLQDSSGHLTIDTVRLEDDGKWQCEAENDLGLVATATPIQLTVLDPPKKPYLLIDNRILDPGNLFIPVKENTQLTISCVVDGGNPKPTLSWELTLGSLALSEGPELSQAPNLTEVPREQAAGARSEARIDKVLRAHHNATVTCKVHHLALDAPSNVSLLIDVQYTPSFAISREPGFGFPIREGMAVSLKCEVDSNPRAAPVWQKDDTDPPVQQSPDGFLNFTSIRREHSGWYKCIARHLLGRFSSIGYFLNVRFDTSDVTSEPDFDIGALSSTGRQVEVALGGAVQLQCPAGTTGCWARTNPQTGSLDPLGAAQDLKLEQILYQEAGEYKCVSPLQDTRKKLESLKKYYAVKLVVTGQPVVIPANQSIQGHAGQKAVLSVEFCANPGHTRIMWISESFRLYPGESRQGFYAHPVTNSSPANCYTSQLSTPPLSRASSGEYNFLVRNPVGIAEGNVYLQVAGIGPEGTTSQDVKMGMCPVLIWIVLLIGALL